MGNDSQIREILHVALLCFIWYGIASGAGVLLKTVLNVFPYPVTIAMVQLLTITVLSKPLFKVMNVRTTVEIDRSYYFKLIVPLSLGKFFSLVCSHVSIWTVPLSYAATVKSMLPLFTVVFSRIILNEKHTLKVYISLVPIVVGVAIASVSEISFNFTGLLAGLLATVGFSIQHIFSKKVLNETKIHHLHLMYLLSRTALLFFLPLWIYHDLGSLLRDENLFQNDNKLQISFLLLMEGLCNFSQNIVAFSLISLVSPLTYSVCNTGKRIWVICTSLIVLGNPVTGVNIFGMMLAICGVFIYNKAKYDANKEKQKSPLPFITQNGHSNLLLNSDWENNNNLESVINKSYLSPVSKMNGFVHLHKVRNGSPNMHNV